MRNSPTEKKTKVFPKQTGEILPVERLLRTARFVVACTATLIIAGFFEFPKNASAAETILLGQAANFTILGGSTVTSTGATIVTGNLGLSPGSSVTGFPPGSVTAGSIHINDALATQAHADAAAAFTQLAGESSTTNLSGQDLGTLGSPLVPGVFHFNTSAQLTGTLILDTGGDPNAAFHFQIGTTLTTATSAAIVFLNGSSDNVFWEVGTSATIGTGTSFNGTIIADQSITFATGASINGRALAVNAAVTLDTNIVNGAPAAIATGRFWNGQADATWSGVNWSPDAEGATSSTLAPIADVVFSISKGAQNQNTLLDFNANISSLTVNDTAAVTVSGPGLLSIVGGGESTGITINAGAGLTTINSDLLLGGSSPIVTVNNTSGLVINGSIDGTIGLTKSGTAQLTLTGINTYTGQTTVLAGTLEVDGSIVGNAVVSAGVLRGVGDIEGNVTNDAVVSPGRTSGPGTLNIGLPNNPTLDSRRINAPALPIVPGNYVQNAAGTLTIRLASTSVYDRLAIGGAAALNGTLSVSYLGGFNAVPGDVFTIITTGNGVSGKFATFNDPHATGTLLTLGVVYQPNEVLLEFGQASFTTGIPDDHCHPNEFDVAHALDALAIAQPAHRLILALDTLPLPQVGAALDLLSPEDLTAIFSAGLVVSEMQAGNIERRLEDVRQGATGFSDLGYTVSDRRTNTSLEDAKDVMSTNEGRGKEMIAPAVESDKRWGFFISGTGEFVDIENTCSARGSSFVTGAVTVGADYRVSKQFVFGGAIGYANTSVDLSGDGRLNIDSGKASLYGTFYNEGFYVNAIAGGGYDSIDTRRATFGGSVRGQTDGADFNGLLGTGYDFHVGGFTVGPIGSMQYGIVGFDGFSETGSLGALRIDSQNQDSLKSAVGLKASYAKKVGGIVITPQARAQWEHEYLTSTSSLDASFTPATPFTVHGPHIGRDGLLADVGASVQLNPKVALFAYYTGELGRENYAAHSVTGGVSVSF
jgi:autotransporter-associated beta strand protein